MAHVTQLIVAVVVMFIFPACSGISTYRYINIYSIVSPKESAEKVYQDRVINVRFWIDEKKVHFELENLSDEQIIIHWNKAAYVNVDEKKYSLSNSEYVFTKDRFNPPSKAVPAGESIIDYVVPVNNVEKLEEWTWYIYPLFNLSDKRAIDNRGKVIGVDLPVEYAGEIRTYTFRFKVTNVTPHLHKTQ